MRLHVAAEFTQDDAGRLVAVNDPQGAPAPRFFLGRTPDGNAWWFRHDIGANLANALQHVCEALPAGLETDAADPSAATFIELLSREGGVQKTWAGPAFVCPSDLPGDASAVLVTSANASVLDPYLDAWRGDVGTTVPMLAVLERGAAVSVCASVRITPEAHEAGVDTHPDFRGRGYAPRAVRAWAKAVHEMGCIPLYSTSWANTASRAVARKLGLRQFGADLHIT